MLGGRQAGGVCRVPRRVGPYDEGSCDVAETSRRIRCLKSSRTSPVEFITHSHGLEEAISIAQSSQTSYPVRARR